MCMWILISYMSCIMLSPGFGSQQGNMRRVNSLQVYTEEIKVPIKSLLYVKFSNFEVLDKTINDLFNDFKAINFQTNFLKKLVHLYQEVSSYGRTLFNSKAQLTVDLSKLEENFLKKVAFFSI